MTELPRKTSVIAFVLLYIAYCISYIDRAAISLALAQIGKDFNLQAADLGIVISAFFLGYAAMQVPGGWLSDRFGSKYVVIVTIVMWSLFTAFTSIAWSLTSLIAIRFIFGIAEGGFPPASIRGISEVFKKDSRPKMSALLLSSNYAGSMVAPLIMAPLILWLGWRHAFNDQWRMYINASGVKKNGGNLNGHIYDAALGLEWFPWKNVGFGAEYAYTKIRLNQEKRAYDLDLDMKLNGPSAYVRFRF